MSIDTPYSSYYKITGFTDNNYKAFFNAWIEFKSELKTKEFQAIKPGVLVTYFDQGKLRFVKYIKEKTGLGLKNAKDLCDILWNNDLLNSTEVFDLNGERMYITIVNKDMDLLETWEDIKYIKEYGFNMLMSTKKLNLL